MATITDPQVGTTTSSFKLGMLLNDTRYRSFQQLKGGMPILRRKAIDTPAIGPERLARIDGRAAITPAAYSASCGLVLR